MCDIVLALFINRETRLTEDDIHTSLKDRNFRNLRTAIQQLVTDGCIEPDTVASGHWYLLKGKGSDIFEMGGYKEYLKELNRKNEIKEILDQYQLDTSKSVIKTNDIVQGNVKSQERLYKLTLLVAAASRFGFYYRFCKATAINRYRDRTNIKNASASARQFKTKV